MGIVKSSKASVIDDPDNKMWIFRTQHYVRIPLKPRKIPFKLEYKDDFIPYKYSILKHFYLWLYKWKSTRTFLMVPFEKTKQEIRNEKIKDLLK